jgi:hypothetical protein
MHRHQTLELAGQPPIGAIVCSLSGYQMSAFAGRNLRASVKDGKASCCAGNVERLQELLNTFNLGHLGLQRALYAQIYRSPRLNSTVGARTAKGCRGSERSLRAELPGHRAHHRSCSNTDHSIGQAVKRILHEADRI